MTDTIPVAVIGAGNMGTNHIRVYDELPETELVEVVEPDQQRACEVNEEYDVLIYDDPDSLSIADAVSIAAPNRHHRNIATTCIEDGLDVLVEKPLAPSVSDARAILETAERHDAILQVGHIERYNPVVETLQTLIEDEDIIAIESHRLGPFNDHLAEESVVFDLLLHDIDVVTSLVSSPVESISAVGSTSFSSTLDHVVSQFQFQNGVLGTMTGSHVTQAKVREIAVTTYSAYIEIDYQSQDILVQQTGADELTSLFDVDGYRTETVTERPYIKTREPLKNELEAFANSVRTGKQPLVDGKEGLCAVEQAQQIIDSLQ